MARHLSSASNRIQGTLNNHGLSFNGNSFQGSHLHFHGDEGASLESSCKSALFQTNPVDDRDAVATDKPRLVHKACEWILEDASLRSWADDDVASRLLWIHGGSGMGKTMMSLYLLEKFEAGDVLRRPQDGLLLFYFIDSRNEKRKTAVSILRGLIHVLLKARPSLMSHLLPDFEIQKEALFSKTALEALWRIFTTMLRDPVTGPVSCLIDALDECQEDGLVRLLRKMTIFIDQEQRGRSPNPVRLKLVLVSREAPACISENLSGYPDIDIAAATARTRVAKTAVGKGQPEESPGDPKPDAKFASMVRLAMEKRKDSLKIGTADETQAEGQVPAAQQAMGALSVEETGPSASPKDSRLDLSAQQATSAEYVFDPPVDDDSQSWGGKDGEGEDPFADSAAAEPVSPAAQPAPQPALPAPVEGHEEGEAQETSPGSLEHYIDARVAQLAEEMGYDEAISATIGAGLRSRGDGTFLWVDLAVDEIKRHPKHLVEDAVDQLLPGFDNMYCSTLLGISADLVPLAEALLRWAVTARRPMYVCELTTVLVLEGFASPDPREMVRQGVAACGSLLALKEGDDTEDGTVQLPHQSVKDFLTAPSGPLQSDAKLARFHVDTARVDGDIAALCIRYLEQGCLKAGRVTDNDAERLERFPFVVYAVMFWADHLRSASNPRVDLNSPFFQPGSSIRKNWWATYYTWTLGKSVYWVPRNFNLLHLAAYVNIPLIAQEMENTGALYSRIDDRDSYGASALELAAIEGNLEMFAFLCSRRAHQQDPVGEDVFHLACKKGQARIVTYLLDRGYDVNSTYTPATKDALNGFINAARWMHGVVDEYKNLETDHFSLLYNEGLGTSGLFGACMFGHTSVVELLLGRGADLTIASTTGWTALHTAAWVGQADCVRVLLQHGADVVKTNGEGLVALHCAATRGKSLVILVLLEYGALVDEPTERKRTALHFAASNGRAEAIKVLVEKGANTEARSYKGETPLHVAARREKPGAVEALLAAGADASATNKEGKTALSALKEVRYATDEQKEVMRILETFGTAGYVPFESKDATEAPTATTTAQAASASSSPTETPPAPAFSYTPPPADRPGAHLEPPRASPTTQKRRSFLSLSGLTERAERLLR